MYWPLNRMLSSTECVSTYDRDHIERLVVISQGADAKNFDEKGSFFEQMGTQNTAEQNSEL
jgi:hypothetical protein